MKITRVFEFDSAHRVMNERVKCYNLHGHRFKAELTFDFDETKAIGYAIDFKELKRIVGTWLDENFDHATILNPKDSDTIEFIRKNGWKLYVMGMGNDLDINPSAENIASEIFAAMDIVFRTNFSNITISSVKLYETPNCFVETTEWPSHRATEDEVGFIVDWARHIGVENYDIRNGKEKDCITKEG